jgi:hypothetical protein
LRWIDRRPACRRAGGHRWTSALDNTETLEVARTAPRKDIPTRVAEAVAAVSEDEQVLNPGFFLLEQMRRSSAPKPRADVRAKIRESGR